MFIEFGKLFIEGFKSIKDLPFDFQQPGINLIRGVNGAGKTTVFEALYWCLFGELLKETNLSGITPKYQDEDFVGTSVKIAFSKGKHSYLIARHKGYKQKTNGYLGGDKLMIFRDGELISEELHKSDLQNAINIILGVGHKTFLNSVLFGQRMKRLVESDAKDKREIFSQFFDLDWIDQAKDKAKGFRDIENQKLVKFDQDLLIIEQKYNAIEDKKQLYEDHKKDWERNKQQELDDLVTDLEEVENSLKAVVKLKEPKKKHKDIDILAPQLEINRLERDHDNLQRDIANKANSNLAYYKTITDLEATDIKTICPVCEGQLSPQKVLQLRKEKGDSLALKRMAYKALEDELVKKEKEWNDLLTKLTKLKKDQADLEAKNKDNTVLKTAYDLELRKYEDAQLQKKQFVSQKEKINSKIAILTQKEYVPLPDANFEEQCEKLQLQKEQIDKDSAKIRQEVINYDWWITKGFGANGLKNYITNSMLQILNRTVRKYSLRLGLTIKFSIDLDGTNKKYNVQVFKSDGQEMDYAELSGGEKTRIDLALSFGIFDLLSEVKTRFNILLLDEAFENLDEAGFYDIFELLRLKSETTNIFFVSHSGVMDMSGVNTITLVKNNNFTEYL